MRVEALAKYDKARIKRALKISLRHAERHGFAGPTASCAEVKELADVHGDKCMIPGCNRHWYMIDYHRSDGHLKGLLCIQCLTILDMVNHRYSLLTSMRQYLMLSGGSDAE